MPHPPKKKNIPEKPSLPNIGGLSISDSAMTNELNNQLLAPGENPQLFGRWECRYWQMIGITIPLGHDFPGNNVPS